MRQVSLISTGDKSSYIIHCVGVEKEADLIVVFTVSLLYLSVIEVRIVVIDV